MYANDRSFTNISNSISIINITETFYKKRTNHYQHVKNDAIIYGKNIFHIITIIYFLTLLFIIASIIYFFITNQVNSPLSKYVIISVPAGIILSLILYEPLDILKYIKYLPSYFYYMATYINLLQIYAICKTDDITWGTRKRPDNGKNANKSNKFLNFKYNKLLYVMLYVFCNSMFAVFLEWYEIYTLNINGETTIPQLIYVIGLLLLIVPFIGQMIFIFLKVKKLFCRRKSASPIPIEIYS